MVYAKYFKSGQKILLRAQNSSGRFEALTTHLQVSAPGCFELTLPYRCRSEETYPFAPGMPFELMSAHLGLGLRMNARFLEQIADDRIRMELIGDLQIFQRRVNRRLDLTVGLRYSKGRGTLRSFWKQWEKNQLILDKTKEFSKLPLFPRSRVNLSVGGIRFELSPPVEASDLCLLLLQIDKTSRPICALAEVIWLDEREGEMRRTAGMQFIGILDADRKRIEDLIKQMGNRAKEPKLQA